MDSDGIYSGDNAKDPVRVKSIWESFSLLAGPFLGYCLLNLLVAFQASLVQNFTLDIWISAIIRFHTIFGLVFLSSSITTRFHFTWVFVFLWTGLLFFCHYMQHKWSQIIRIITHAIFILLASFPFFAGFFGEGYSMSFIVTVLFLYTLLFWFISFNYLFYLGRVARTQPVPVPVYCLWVIWVLFLSLAFLMNPALFLIGIK